MLFGRSSKHKRTVNESSGKRGSLTYANVRVPTVSSIMGIWNLLKILFIVSKHIPLVYENINFLGYMLNIAANVGTRKCFNKGVLGVLYLAMHTLLIGVFFSVKFPNLCSLN